MFTGIISATAQVIATTQVKDGLQATFEMPSGWDDVVLGESIAVNGVCLTVSALHDGSWSALLMPETLSVTSFHKGMPNSVNLERAMPLTERLSGHIVQGHVDGVGKVVKVDTTDGYEISIEFPAISAGLVVYKGSITIDGVSLTVTKLAKNILRVALIPHTLASTTLGNLQKNDIVNLEFDVIGKYVANLLQQENHATR